MIGDMGEETTEKRAKDVLAACHRMGFMLATAESCTGGLIAASLTDIAGASRVLDRGFITYTNEAKHEMLGVPMALFGTVGAVSEEVARAMAEGALRHSRARIAVSVTGIAGPDGGTREKPVGLVHMSVAFADAHTRHERHVFSGDRHAVRSQAVNAALLLVSTVLKDHLP